MNEHDLLDAAAAHAHDFFDRLATSPVAASGDQNDMRKMLGRPLPMEGDDQAEILNDLIEASRTGVTLSAGPRFFGYVIGGAYPVGIATDWLATAWDHHAGTPLAAPLGCAIEDITEAWTLELLDLPRNASVGIVTGATMGSFVGIAAARHKLLKDAGWDVEANGLFGAPEIRVLVGADAHPTLFAGLRFAGFGSERVVSIETDDEGRMRPEAFLAALRNGDGPTLVCTQAGHVSTGAFDPFETIAPACRETGAWLHVDGAFGLWARAGGEAQRRLARGVEHADSWSVDAHKWLNTPYDGAFAIVRHPDAHRAAMSVSASYLPQVDGGRDPSAFVPELSRKARGLAIYAVIRALGRNGVQALVEQCCAHARRMRDRMTEEPGVECLNAVDLNQAIFRFSHNDPGTEKEIMDETVERVRAGGECWVQSADWRGVKVMRFSVVNYRTTEADIDRSADAILNELRRVRAKHGVAAD